MAYCEMLTIYTGHTVQMGEIKKKKKEALILQSSLGLVGFTCPQVIRNDHLNAMLKMSPLYHFIITFMITY